MWNPFKKKNDDQVAPSSANTSGTPKMGMLQRLAMKKLESMSPAEREKLMQKVLTPKNIAKHKNEIVTAMDQMLASGQINRAQYEEGKKRLGL